MSTEELKRQSSQLHPHAEASEAASSPSTSMSDSISSAVVDAVSQATDLASSMFTPLEASSTSSSGEKTMIPEDETMATEGEAMKSSGSAEANTISSPPHVQQHQQQDSPPQQHSQQGEHRRLPRLFHSPTTSTRSEQKEHTHQIESAVAEPSEHIAPARQSATSHQILADALGVDLESDSRRAEIRHRVHDSIIDGSNSKVYPSTFHPSGRGSAEAKHRVNTKGLVSGIDGHKNIQQFGGGRRQQSLRDGGRQAKHFDP